MQKVNSTSLYRWKDGVHDFISSILLWVSIEGRMVQSNNIVSKHKGGKDRGWWTSVELSWDKKWQCDGLTVWPGNVTFSQLHPVIRANLRFVDTFTITLFLITSADVPPIICCTAIHLCLNEHCEHSVNKPIWSTEEIGDSLSLSFFYVGFDKRHT